MSPTAITSKMLFFWWAWESEDTCFAQELAEALTHPVFPLYLGRRACPPTLPLCLGLAGAGPCGGLAGRARALPRAGPKPTRIVADAAPQEPGAVPQRDVPLSYDRGTGSTVTARPGKSPSGSPQGPRSRPPMTHSVNCEVKCRCIYPV